MPKSVGRDDSLLNTLALTGLKARGGARSTWQAVAFCIEQGIDFPPWVIRYLAETAEQIEDHLVNRDLEHPHRLWEALGLNGKAKAEHYDHKRDPEEVYEVIETWRTDGEAKNVAEGARRYHEEVLGGIGEPETVRGLYYAGKRLSKLSMYERMARKSP